MSADNSHKQVTAAEWGQHLVIVFTVLIGVSLAQAFSLLAEPSLDISQLLLMATVFYVVFDCWYALNTNVRYIQATGGFDITLYLLTLVSYSCLPFLYLADTTDTPFEPPEFLTANLALICLLDATQRAIVFRRNGDKASPDEERWHTKNTYLMLSGYFVGALLIIGTFTLASWDISATLRAAIILAVWVIVRVFDRWGYDYFIVNKLLRSKRKTSEPVAPQQPPH